MPAYDPFDGTQVTPAQQNGALLAAFCRHIAKIDPWEEATIEAATRAFTGNDRAMMRHLSTLCRIALIGEPSGHPLFNLLYALGRDTSLGLLQDAFVALLGEWARPGWRPDVQPVLSDEDRSDLLKIRDAIASMPEW